MQWASSFLRPACPVQLVTQQMSNSVEGCEITKGTLICFNYIFFATLIVMFFNFPKIWGGGSSPPAPPPAMGLIHLGHLIHLVLIGKLMGEGKGKTSLQNSSSSHDINYRVALHFCGSLIFEDCQFFVFYGN